MQNLFHEVASLDARCYEKFGLSEDILMEHAAEGMAAYIRKKFPKNSTITVVVGSGNNGADGIALARLLHGDYEVSLYHVKVPKSPMAQLQKKRADAVGVPTTNKITECDVLIDAIVGTGFTGEFTKEIANTLNFMNEIKGYKIACDVPSGFKFYADATLTMGALKTSLFEDAAKDCVGEIQVIDLGVSRKMYEQSSPMQLLEFTDMELPKRKIQNSHKGNYGHLAVLSGEKTGASILCAEAAFRLGTALVTLISNENIFKPYQIMQSHQLPPTTSAIALGMGLGVEFSNSELESFLDNNLPLVLDADIFYHPLFLKFLQRENVILTPHPKEFCQILKVCNLADIDVNTLQKDRLKYVQLFSARYKNVVLVLKGANVLICQDKELFINPYGSNVLAKGGSGDVLAGLIASLLSQGYSTLQSAINGSLIHTKLAQNYSGADFSLTPNDLIEGIGKL